MKVRKIFQLIFIVLNFGWASASWGFVSPQSACKINCLNNGVCAYDIGNQDRHKCICLIDMFEGEFCEFKVTSTTTTQEPLLTSTTDGAAIYDEEDEFHEASPDLHYTEFNQNDVQQKNLESTPQQADEYAEFEPHNDEVYHEAVISPSESVQEPISVESQTDASVYTKTTQPDTYYQQGNQQNEIEPEQDDEFYEDDSSWMMFKRRAVNGANKQQNLLFFTCLLIAFIIQLF